MMAVVQEQPQAPAQVNVEVQTTATPAETKVAAPKELVMGKNYLFREGNWEIGRAAERAGVKVKEFVPGDRFAAWRNAKKRSERSAEKKRMQSVGKKGKNKN